MILVVASLRPVPHTKGCPDPMFLMQAPSTQITTQKARRGTEEMVKNTHADNSKRWQSQVPGLLHGTSNNVVMESVSRRTPLKDERHGSGQQT